MKNRYFELARNLSFRSDHPQHKIGGVLVKKNRVISVGFNKVKTHTKSTHIYKNIHCELDCILGVDRDKLKDSTIYLYRQDKMGNISMSKPCIWCRVLLKECGVKSVCYTTNGDYIEEKVIDL